ncbi:hypothetical protein CALCODRAFT_29128 [Calocera cornea HHB12733]|uniref:Uncharacterized protein n=1 Tax=Calocera cornea HHB12733 TaxID=1353952 RepID=A0A165E3U9_9BASI|nr:hypothetical protein CALCODRAFT_29128 [Calocera cornea HHB12733]
MRDVRRSPHDPERYHRRPRRGEQDALGAFHQQRERRRRGVRVVRLGAVGVEYCFGGLDFSGGCQLCFLRCRAVKSIGLLHFLCCRSRLSRVHLFPLRRLSRLRRVPRLPLRLTNRHPAIRRPLLLLLPHHPVRRKSRRNSRRRPRRTPPPPPPPGPLHLLSPPAPAGPAKEYPARPGLGQLVRPLRARAARAVR